MNSRFAKGLIIGSVIGASVGMISNSNMLKGRNRRRMIKSGRNMLKKSSDVISDVIDLFR